MAWQDEWQGMPEFVMEKQRAYAEIVIRVDDPLSLVDLSARLGQPLTPKTKSVWHPYRSHWNEETWRWK